MASGSAIHPEGQGHQETTRACAPVYAGDAHGLNTWKLRVLSHWKYLAPVGAGEEEVKRQDRERVQYASKILEGLNDDALRIAEDLGVDQLIDKDGVPTLVVAVEEFVKKKKDQEAHRRAQRH